VDRVEREVGLFRDALSCGRVMTIARRPISSRDRLIVALDVPGYEQALALVDTLGDSVGFYKLGLELAMSGRYFELAETLTARGKKIFADLKFYDIPATVASAVRQLAKRGVEFATVHGGNHAILEAACAEKGALAILAVTVLTSLDAGDFQRDLGVPISLPDLVISRARSALASGCDGVIASGSEAHRLREALGGDFLIVAPGIRPSECLDDQKRVVTPRQAFEAGADHIVVGRPIRDAADPRVAAEAIQRTIGAIFD
jgi:orotidine-5'-phosphate decarboxylase